MNDSLPIDEHVKTELHRALIDGAGVAELFNLITQKSQWTKNDVPRLLIVQYLIETFGFDVSVFKLAKQATYRLDYSAESGWTVDDWEGEELLLALKSKTSSHDD